MSTTINLEQTTRNAASVVVQPRGGSSAPGEIIVQIVGGTLPSQPTSRWAPLTRDEASLLVRAIIREARLTPYDVRIGFVDDPFGGPGTAEPLGDD